MFYEIVNHFTTQSKSDPAVIQAPFTTEKHNHFLLLLQRESLQWSTAKNLLILTPLMEGLKSQTDLKLYVYIMA